MKKQFLLFFFFLLSTISQSKPLDFEIPQLKPNEKVIKHVAYSFSYNETYEQANWVAYELTSSETNPIVKRNDNFIEDPAVSTHTANAADYKGSGYDRGHLAPSADMCFSQITMQESFYYSNMSPQEPAFNRGIWSQIESLVRLWAKQNESIYIVTGPVLKSGLPTIGNNKVAIPKYYYKVILDYTEPSLKGIAFLIENKGSKLPLQNFVVSIDSVEKVTGINFFPLLPKNQEQNLESKFNFNIW